MNSFLAQQDKERNWKRKLVDETEFYDTHAKTKAKIEISKNKLAVDSGHVVTKTRV